MRARPLPLVALLLLGGGMAAWFVSRARPGRAPAPPAELPVHPADAVRGEALDPLGGGAATAESPARDRAPVATGPEAGPGAAAPGGALAALRGFVLAENDAPVEDFDLLLERQALLGGEHLERHFHGPKGEFRFDSLTEGTWSVELRAAGYVPIEPIQKIQSPLAAPLLLHVRRTTFVRGVVVDDAGAPALDAKAEATRIVHETPGEAWSAECGEQGGFLFNDLPPGEYLFRAVRGEMRAGGDALRRTLEADRPIEGLTLRLHGGGTITGEIVAERRGEFRGGRVMLLAGIEDLRERHTDLEEDRFRFATVPAGTWWLVADVQRAPEGESVLLTGQCTVTEGGTTHVVLGASAPDCVRVHGRVLRDGQPLPGSRVAAFLDGRPALESLRLARADAEGRYELELDRPGPATFLASTRDDVDFSAPRTRALVPSGREFTLDLRCASVGLRGLVLDAQGVPCADETVWDLPVDSSRIVLQSRSARTAQTDAQGRFEFPGLAAGEHLLLAGGQQLERPSGPRARASLRLAEGELRENITLRLPRPTRIRGIVRDAAGRACPGMQVFARGSAGELFQPWWVGSSREDGGFTCKGLPPGAYSFFARAPAAEFTGRGPLATPQSAPIDVHEANSLEYEIEVLLIASPATLLRAEVLDRRDLPLPAEVLLFDGIGQEVGGTVGAGDLDDALAHGAFGHRSRFGPLPPGNYTLEARTSDGHVATRKFTLAGEPERKLTLRVE